MPFGDSFPLRALGPKSDLAVAYVHADIGASGAPTMDATKTTAGFSITQNSTGNYNLVFRSCRFCLPLGQVRMADVTAEAQVLQVLVAADLDASTGTVVFVTGDEAGAETDPASGSEIVFLVLLGY